MRIKEVEERTGLTAKAIRLYESKGLLNVARDTENDYRDYTEEDVARLKVVAFLREMDISIQGIKDWVDGKLTIQDLMRYTAGQANDAENAAKLRCELAKEVLRLMEVDPELDLLEAMEDVQTLRELKQEMEKIEEEIHGNLVLPVIATIIALGPIGWTVINILTSRTHLALVSFGLSIVALIFLFISWSSYFRVARENRMKSGCLPTFLMAVVALVIVGALIYFVSMCQEALFATQAEALLLFRYPWMNILILLPIAEIFIAFNWNRDNQEETVEPPSRKQRVILWLLLVAFNLTMLYGCISSVTVCENGGFTRYGFFCPQGKHYSLEQVESVEVGFYGSSIPMISGHQSGDFYYKITFSDGHTEDWAQSSPSNDADSWEALLALDAWLMSADIEKTVSNENRDKALYDREIFEICDAILNQK